MSNHKHKANYQSGRSCGLCKPHKRLGNSKERVKAKYRMEPKVEGEPAPIVIPEYVDPQAV